MNKIRKGDQVIVITGKDKGKTGVVLRRVDDTHLIVEGVNLSKKHTKPNPMKGQQGGIVDKAMPIDQSNVAILNPSSKKADRVGIIVAEDGSKQRIYKSDRAPIASAPSA
ncbi:MAG: 50S ribosomal protein L24 [Betaproteobacteria bacterium]|jgi:large subunit ribosomal protein L24|nr:50S ribosomal protein L24 [Betaproteobacteria bacterium]